jgi:hypothetical protein
MPVGVVVVVLVHNVLCIVVTVLLSLNLMVANMAIEYLLMHPDM